jgi:hypothetical protein
LPVTLASRGAYRESSFIMLVFRDVDESYRTEMRAFIAQNEKDGRKPLTWGLFRVTPGGIEAI